MNRFNFSGSVSVVIATLFTVISFTQLPAVEDSARSLEEIRAVVKGLHKEDVAWRSVSWRTCLIDGLQESRRTGKPLVLWIFIDRPIDDERC